MVQGARKLAQTRRPRLWVRLPPGALKRIELLDPPVEQFFALIRFENRERLDDLIKLTAGIDEV
jgi:hypothetical protein